MNLEQAKTRAKTANRVALETEKEKDTAEKAVGNDRVGWYTNAASSRERGP